MAATTNMNSFKIPKKALLTLQDLDTFQTHPSMLSLQQFILDLNEAAKDKPLDDPSIVQDDICKELIYVLKEIHSWIELYPPAKDEKTRFGNPSYRQWFDHLQTNITTLLTPIIHDSNACDEVAVYLLHAFGDRKRIDYGTGHELSFIIFLYCLSKLSIINPQSYPSITLQVFQTYLTLMRALQSIYWLEPAGSHGVWGLDDYHFLPFLFGSSQLISHKHLRPKSILNKEIREEFKNKYFYFELVDWICEVKKEGLGWHSPMLNDICAVKTWSKVNSGLFKMYIAEVLSKLPIMQHVRFGSLFPFDEGSADVFPRGEEEGDDGHSHVYAFGQEFPKCCGMRVPAAFGAAEEGKKGLFPID